MSNLTIKQRKAYNYIKAFYKENGYTPTTTELAKGLGLKSVSSAHRMYGELVSKGFLNKAYNYSEITLNEEVPTDDTVQVVGTIAAGQPILAVEESDPKSISVSKLPINKEFYALLVKGDSMIEDGIFDGDIVVIKKQDYAEEGETVVAIINDNEATLKRLDREKDKYRLQPANQKMLPIFVDNLEVGGVVWQVIRNFTNKSTPSRQTFRTLDLFAGVGGIRLGFEEAGFKTVFANDFEKACKLTYDANFKISPLVVEDITKIKEEELPPFDFLLGGFPCQAFSIAGYRKGFEDEKGRGNLFFDIARILDYHKPAGFLLENVKNLKGHDGGNTYKVIEKTLYDLGYSIKSKVLNTMEYGNVPQNRERLYVVGFKDKAKAEKFEFPEKIELKNKVIDLLDKKVDEKYYYTDKPLHVKLEPFVNEKGQVYQWRRKYVRKNQKGVCPTLTANMGMGGHNVPIILDDNGIRKLTPRECFRFQGFPDSYELPKISDTSLYKQAGNSVSVPVVKRVAEKMLEVM